MDEVFFVSYGLLWVVAIFQSLILIGIVRTIYRTRETSSSEPSNDGDLRGQRVPAFSAVAVSGDRIESTEVPGRALLFVSPDCPSCSVTLEELEALRRTTDGRLIVVCRGGRDECARLAEGYELDGPVVLDGDLLISKLFRVHEPPAAVLVNDAGVIQPYRYPKRGSELEELLEQSPEGDTEEVRVS